MRSMNQTKLLENFEYKSYYLNEVKCHQSFRVQSKNQLSLLDVKIDFAAGRLVLEAHKPSIIPCNRHKERQGLLVSRKRVQIQMSIFDCGAIDLNDPSNNGLIFPLEGSIVDCSIQGSCIGMLVFKNKFYHTKDGSYWLLAFYIYDSLANYGEIRFDLPIDLAAQFQMN
jgi:hypothetical protein